MYASACKKRYKRPFELWKVIFFSIYKHDFYGFGLILKTLENHICDNWRELMRKYDYSICGMSGPGRPCYSLRCSSALSESNWSCYILVKRSQFEGLSLSHCRVVRKPKTLTHSLGNIQNEHWTVYMSALHLMCK